MPSENTAVSGYDRNLTSGPIQAYLSINLEFKVVLNNL